MGNRTRTSCILAKRLPRPFQAKILESWPNKVSESNPTRQYNKVLTTQISNLWLWATPHIETGFLCIQLNSVSGVSFMFRIFNRESERDRMNVWPQSSDFRIQRWHPCIRKNNVLVDVSNMAYAHTHPQVLTINYNVMETAHTID